MKHHLAVRLLGQLNHIAVLTKPHFKLEKIFVSESIGTQEAIGNRHFAELDKRLKLSFTDKTLRHPTVP